MADLAVTSALVLLEEVYSFLHHQLNLKEKVLEEVDYIRNWLSRMQAYLKDKVDNEFGEVEKDKVKRVREVAYDIEDVLDEFMLHVPHDQRHRHKHTKKLRELAHTGRHWIPLHKISSKIQKVKRKIDDIKDLDSLSIGSSTSMWEEGSSSGTRIEHLRTPVFDDDEIVGFEKPTKELVDRLMDAESRCVTIPLFGSGGSGKSILVKNVYESRRIKGHFDCHAWVRVSPSFKDEVLEDLLYNMLKQFCASRKEPVPSEEVDAQAKLRNYLQEKRYVLVLDDIWRNEHWECIKNALPRRSSFGSRIIVTTPILDVASSCVGFSQRVIELTGLPWPEAWGLFCKKAFRNGNGKCPRELEDCSQRIVKKCEGLPLAIVAVGGLLSKKPPIPNEWEKLHDSLGSEIGTSISRILLPSYKDLPSHLRSCFLYFSIFPEDCSIERGRLIRLLVAERFVVEATGKTPEEVAEDYINELIGRNLIHVSSWDFDGRVKSCRVQNLVLDFIVQKSKDENFILVLAEPFASCSNKDKVRRLSALNAGRNLSLVRGIDGVRSIFLSRWENLSSRQIGNVLSDFKLLRVLDLQGAPLDEFPKDIVNLTLLRYLSFRDTRIKMVPKSIEKLSFLQTLDLRQTNVTKLPEQISSLHNLRHLLVYCYKVETYVTFDSVQGAKVVAGIGGLTNLQKLSLVNPERHREIINELGSLTQLRKLGLIQLKREDGKELCTSVQQMQKLTTFDVCSTNKEEYLDLEGMNNPPRHLQRLYLKGHLERFPRWISSLDNLFRIGLKWSRLEGSPLEALQHLPNLIELDMVDAYTGKELVFEAAKFKKLKILHIEQFDQLHMVVIQEGTMPELQKLTLCKCEELKMAPLGINYLACIEQLLLYEMPAEFIAQLQKTSVDRYMVSRIPVIHSFTLRGNQYWTLQNLS